MRKKMVLRIKFAAIFMMLVLLCGCRVKENATQQSDVVSKEISDNKPDNSKITDVDFPIEMNTEENTISSSENTDKIITAYHGVITDNSYEEGGGYDIQLIKEDTSDWKIVFIKWNNGSIWQTIEKKIDFIIHPSSLSIPIKIVDIKKDGYMDYIVDYGILGKMRKGECIIWNSETLKYSILEGYSDLCNPNYDSHNDMIYETFVEGMTTTIRNQYRVENNKLELVATMIEDYNNGHPRYTEKRKIDDEFVVVQDNLPENEVSFEGWDMFF